MADLLYRAPIQYEPITTNRYVLRFPSDIGIQPMAIQSIKAPSITLETKEMGFINTSTYVNTKYKWEKMNMTIRDYVAPSQAQALMEWIRLCAESVTGRMGYAIGYAKNLELDVLDPTGVAFRKWQLVHCIPTDSVSFGEFNYDNGDLLTIDLTIQPQYCVLLYG